MNMNIYSRPGTKVKYAHSEAGWFGEREAAKKNLELGKVYTVNHTLVHDARTEVWLDEVPGRSYSSCAFDEV